MIILDRTLEEKGNHQE